MSAAATLRLLMVEDSEDDAQLLLREIRRGGFDVSPRRVDTPEAMRAALRDELWDLVTCDYVMPRFGGPAALSLLHDTGLDIPFIVVSGQVGEETAVEMLKAGAHDFIMKGTFSRLVPAMRRELADARIRRERKLAQSVLAESQVSFHMLASVSPVGIVYSDAKGDCLYVNERWCELAGMSAKAASGTGWARSLHPADRERVATGWYQATREAHAFDTEYRFTRPDSSTVWVLGRAMPERNAAGEVIGWVGTVTDITRLKIAEWRLGERVKEQRCLHAVSALAARPDLGEEGLLEAALAPVAAAFQFPERMAVRIRHGERRYQSAQVRETPSALAADLRVGDAVEGTVEVGYAEAVAAGEEPFLPEEVTLVKEVTSILGVAVARRRSENALAASQARFRALTENSSDLVVVVAPDGRVTYVSPSITRISGYAAEDVLDRPFAEFVHPEDVAIAAADLCALSESPGLPHASELRYRHKDGHWIVLASVSKNAIDDPAVRGLVVNARDVTERKRHETQLQLFRALVDAAPAKLEIVDPQTLRPLDCNVAAFKSLGYTREEFFAMSIPDIEATSAEKMSSKAEEIRARGSASFETHHRRKDGSIFPVHVSAKLVELDKPYIVSVVLDMTEQRHAAEQIRRQNRMLAVLSSINSLIVRVHDRDELYREACRIAVEAGELPLVWIAARDAAKGLMRTLAHSGDDGGFVDLPRPAAAGAEEQFAMSARALASGRSLVCNDIAAEPAAGSYAKEALERGYRAIAALPLVVGGAPVAVLMMVAREPGFFDAGEMKLVEELAGDIAFAVDHIAKEEKVHYLAYYDALTGLPNRTFFMESLGQQLKVATQVGKSLAIVVADIERFRNVNDTLGRAAGDALMREIAMRMRKAIGEHGQVARMHADIFGIVITDIDGEATAARRVSDTLAQACGQPLQVAHESVRLAMRSGIALFPVDAADAEGLYKNAETALKKAKEATEPYLFYSPEMNARVALRLNLETRLHRALEQGQFELHYQPKFDSRSGAIVGLEALMRWNDPGRGLVSPAEFIPILEETGLILPVGAWALGRAVRQCLEWRSAGLPSVRIAVNVSARQLRDKGFVAVVHQALQRGGAERWLDLEITESLIMKDIEGNIAKLCDLREDGVRCAIDDFGTGYSSLAYLSKLPVDTLKIDRSFIVAMPKSPDDMGIVSMIITLAHQLNLKVVAEGVDSEEQAKLLRLLKCDQMQGFLFSKPIPAPAVAELLARPARRAIPEAAG